MHWKTGLGGRNKRHFSAEILTWAVVGVRGHMCTVEVIHPVQGLLSVALHGGPFGNRHGFILLCAAKLESCRDCWTDLSVWLNTELLSDLVSLWNCGSRKMPSEGHLLSDVDLTTCSERQPKRLRWYFNCRCTVAVKRLLSWVFQSTLFASPCSVSERRS